MRLTYVGPLVPELKVFEKNILMQDPDLKCRHFGILWHFMVFYGILWYFGIFAKKSIKKSNPIFQILSDFIRFFPIFRLFPTFRLLDSTTLVHISPKQHFYELLNV